MDNDDLFIQKYESVLQNIEAAIIKVYRQHPDLTDARVDAALEGLVRLYTTAMKGRSAPKLKLSEVEQEICEEVKIRCDWWLGRRTLRLDGEDVPGPQPPLTHEETVACLRRIRSSIKLWTTEFGKTGYLRFVSQYFPDE